MGKQSSNIDDEAIQMVNVNCVIDALAFLETAATEDELVKCFATSSDEPVNIIQEEIKRILQHTVMNGWIIRNADKYTLPNRENEYQIDGDDDGDTDDDAGDDADVVFIPPRYSHYEVHSSPTARETGRGYERVRTSTSPFRPPTSSTPTPPPKSRRPRKKTVPAPTDRVTRSSSRTMAAATAPRAKTPSRAANPKRKREPAKAPSPPKKAKKEPKAPRSPTRFSSRTVGKKGGRRGGR